MFRLCIVLFGSVFGSCGWIGNLCENVPSAEVISSEYVATVFTRGCGTASGDYEYLNIRRASARFDFESPTQITVSLKSKPIIRWKGNSLILDCHDCLKSSLAVANDKIRTTYPDITLEYGK